LHCNTINGSDQQAGNSENAECRIEFMGSSPIQWQLLEDIILSGPLQFPIKWVYSKGEDNIADPLSRFHTFYLAVLQVEEALPCEPAGGPPPFALHSILDSIRAGYKSDPVFAAAVPGDIECVDGLYFYKDRIIDSIIIQTAYIQTYIQHTA